MDTNHHSSSSNLSRHKYLRLIWEQVLDHQHKDILSFYHGTVLVRGGSVLSIGFNSPHRCGFSDHYAPHSASNIHSELSAIRACRKKIDLTGAVAYNLRRNLTGSVRLAKPCPGCMRLLVDYGIKKCYYTTDTGDLACIKVGRLDN